MKTIKKLLACSVALAALAGAAPALAQEELKVEVIHNLASPSQQPTLNVLIEAFKKKGGTWVDSPIAGGSNARQAMVNRAMGGDPAEVNYVHAQLVFRELVEAGLLQPVDPEGWQDWQKNVPAAIWSEMINADGKVMITPIILGIHNVGFFNKHVLDKAGATTPTDWDNLFVALDKVKASQPDVIPLALSETPIQMFQMFHNITAGVGGAALYDRIFSKHEAAAFDDPAFRKVAETFRKLKPYTDEGRTSRKWQDAANLVATGKAGSMVYGTFTLEAILSEGAEVGKDFVCSNLGGVAVLGPNGFMYGKPNNEAEHKAQNLFASIVMDPVVQAEFVRVGGGLPSRLDADKSSVNQCMRDVEGGLAQPGMNVKDPSMTMPQKLAGAVQDTAIEFWADDKQTVDQFIANLKAVMPN